MKKSIYLITFLSLSLSMQAQQVDIVKLYNQAQAATEMGYLDDAIEMYTKILKINPQFAKGYLELGNIYLKKGQDASSLANAYRNFTEYLRLNPNAEDAQAVKNSLDKLEYVLKKTSQKEAARGFLLGRWASTDGKTDKYGRSIFILDISEFDNKIRIDIEPSSLLYSKDFVTKTAYIDDINADQYVFSFTNDNTYIPSQAGYDYNSRMISHLSNQIFGGSSLGSLADGIGQFLNSSKQEKDQSKKTITIYDLKINSIPNENQELVCKGRMFIKQISQTGEKVLLDSVFTTGFYKVKSGYVNRTPIKSFYGDLAYDDKQYQSSLIKEKGVNYVDIHKQIKNGISTNPEISKLYKKGDRQRRAGLVITYLGGLTCGAGAVLWITSDKQMYDSDDEKYKNEMKSVIETSKILTFVGAGIFTLSIPLHIAGRVNRQKAIDLYNESINKSIENRRETSQLKIGVVPNGIGLAITF